MRIKQIAFLLVIILAMLCFVGCNRERDEYEVYLALDSYEDLQLVWSHAIEGAGPYYSFGDNIGGGVKTVYLFVNSNVWKPMPDTINEYLEICTPDALITYLFFTEGKMCQDEKHSQGLYGAKAFSEEISEYAKYPYVKLAYDPDFTIEIEDTSLISHTCKGEGENIIYYISYEGVPFLMLEGCAELSDEDIELLVSHIFVLGEN